MVIGDPERLEKDRPLLNNKVFEETIYAPINEIRIETGWRTRIIYKKPVELNAAIPIPTIKSIDFFIPMLTVLQKNTYLPFGVTSLLLFSKKFLMLSRLREEGFVTRGGYYGLSPEIFQNTKFYFPLEVLTESRTVKVETKKQLFDFIGFHGKGREIYIREVVDTPVTESLVVGDELVGTIKHMKKKSVKSSSRRHTRKQIINSVKTLGSTFGSVKMFENEIIEISLNPDFAMFNKILKKRASDEVLKYMRKKIEENFTVFDSLLDKIGGIIK